MNRKTVIKCTILIIGIIVIPLLYSFFYLQAFWDPYNTLGNVPVAVVNDDTGAVINGQNRNLGKEATDELTKNTSLKFISTNGTDAQSGAEGTKYYAVITFPANFSQNIASASTTDKQTAEITFGANKKRNYIASQVMKTVVANLEESTRGSVDQEITSTLSDQLRKVPGQLNTLSGGLKQLSTGANSLSDGTSKAAAGQLSLSSGIQSLNSGIGTLYNGSTSLSGGLQTLSNGLSQASSGTKQLTAALAQNGPALVSGANQLNSGAQSLLAQFSPSKDPKNPTVYDGVTGVAGGAQSLLAQFASSGNPQNPSVYDGVTGVASGAQSYASAVDNTLYTMITSNPGSSQLLTGYETNLAQVQAAYTAATDPTIKAQYAQQLQMLANLVAIYSTALNPAVQNESTFESTLVSMGTADPTKQSVVYSGAALTAGAQQTAAQFKDGGAFKSGVQNLAAAASQVAAQFKNGGAFKSGAQNLAAGTKQLASGTSSLSTLSSSVSQLEAALSALQNGAQQASSGANQLTSGLATAQNGGKALQSGSAALVSASAQINSGANKLSSGLATANSGVTSSISDANSQIKSLSGLDTYAKAPVNVKEKDINPVPNYGTAFAPYFMSLSLWVGALLMFFGIYLDADERIKILSRHSDKRVVRVIAFALIGIAQAVALDLIVQFGLGLAIDNVPAYYLSCMLISLVFISIVEFLIVNLRDVGKFLAIAFLVLQLTSCGGTFPMETVPKFFNVLYPYMPMTYSVKLLKEVTSNFNTAAAWQDAGVLIGIFAVFTALTLLLSATRKARVLIKEKLELQS